MKRPVHRSAPLWKAKDPRDPGRRARPVGAPSALKWLLLCFPYGLFLMWRRGCRWNVIVKAGVTALFAAAALAIVLFPSPDRASKTLVVLVGPKPEAEVFGPALPESYDPSGYYVQPDDDPILAAAEESDTVYVYASSAEGSTYYHTARCKYASGGQKMTLYEAYMLGYRTPCNLCNPPVYDPTEGN